MPWRCWFVLKHQPSLPRFLGGGNSNSLRFTPPWGHDIIQSDDHIFQYFFSTGGSTINWIWSKFFHGAHYTCLLLLSGKGGSGKTPWHCTLRGAVPYKNTGVVLWRPGSRGDFCWGQGMWGKSRIKVMKSESIWESVVKSCWFKEEIWLASWGWFGRLSMFILWFTGFYTSQVIVWEFFHQQYESTKQKKTAVSKLESNSIPLRFRVFC